MSQQSRKVARSKTKLEDTPKAQVAGKAKPSAPRSKFLRERPLVPLEALLGKVLLTKDKETINPKTWAVDGCVIGLYFAAHWCPPCRSFTPQLAMLHDQLREQEKQLEVVYVSFDYNEQLFWEYFSKMPWCAIDFTDSDRREEVALRFGIRGIPVLVLLDAKSLDVITLNGREIVMSDPLGENFPWKHGNRRASRGAPSGLNLKESQISQMTKSPEGEQSMSRQRSVHKQSSHSKGFTTAQSKKEMNA